MEIVEADLFESLPPAKATAPLEPSPAKAICTAPLESSSTKATTEPPASSPAEAKLDAPLLPTKATTEQLASSPAKAICTAPLESSSTKAMTEPPASSPAEAKLDAPLLPTKATTEQLASSPTKAESEALAPTKATAKQSESALTKTTAPASIENNQAPLAAPTMSTGYLKGVVASVYTSHFNAYASFEVLTEPQKMFLAVEYMNGITLTFGDSLPKHELVFIAGIFDSHRDFQVVPSSFLCLDPPTLLKWLCETKNCGPETQPNAETWALVPFNSFLDAIGGGDKVDPNDLLITSCFTDTNQFRHALAAFTLHFTKLKEEKDPAYNHIFFAPKAQLDGHGSSTANTSAVDPSSHQNASNSKQCSKFDDEDVSPAQSEDETKKNDDIFELSDSSGSEEDENEVGGDSLLGNLGKRKRKPRSKAALLASLEEQGLAYRSSGRVLAQNGAIEKGLGSSASGSGQPLGENPKPNLKPPPKKPPPKKPTPKQDEVDLMSRTQLDEVAILYGMTRKELRAIKVEQLRPIVRKFKLKKPPQKTPSSPPPPPPPPPPTLPLVKPVAKTVLPSEPAQVTTTSLPKPTLEVSNDKLPALHSGFMNQQQSQLDFQVKVLDVALNFAERYNNRGPVPATPVTGASTPSNNLSSTRPQGQQEAPIQQETLIQQETPILQETSTPLTSLDVAWSIVNEESAWLSAEAKKSVLTDQLGVTSSEDIKYLGTDEIQSLARNLKIAKRNRFLAQFPGNFDNN